jgi:hypothetical protein
VYQKTLQRSSCYFLAFALCVTATDCRIPETALFPEQDERAPGIQFSLHKDTLALFRSWARFQGYDANESFVGFIEQLPESPAEDEEVETEPEVATESNIATEAIVEDSLLKTILMLLRESSETGVFQAIPPFAKP